MGGSRRMARGRFSLCIHLLQQETVSVLCAGPVGLCAAGYIGAVPYRIFRFEGQRAAAAQTDCRRHGDPAAVYSDFDVHPEQQYLFNEDPEGGYPTIPVCKNDSGIG